MTFIMIHAKVRTPPTKLNSANTIITVNQSVTIASCYWLSEGKIVVKLICVLLDGS